MWGYWQDRESVINNKYLDKFWTAIHIDTISYTTYIRHALIRCRTGEVGWVERVRVKCGHIDNYEVNDHIDDINHLGWVELIECDFILNWVVYNRNTSVLCSAICLNIQSMLQTIFFTGKLIIIFYDAIIILIGVISEKPFRNIENVEQWTLFLVIRTHYRQYSILYTNQYTGTGVGVSETMKLHNILKQTETILAVPITCHFNKYLIVSLFYFKFYSCLSQQSLLFSNFT